MVIVHPMTDMLGFSQIPRSALIEKSHGIMSRSHIHWVGTQGKPLTPETQGGASMEERVKQPQVESLMTARQVAEFLQVSVCTIGRWSRRGALKFYRVGGRGDMRYRLKDVLSFLEESSSRSRADAMGKKVPVRPNTDILSVLERKARPGEKSQLMPNSTPLDASELLRDPENRLGAFTASPYQRVPDETEVAHRKEGES